jgi:arsenate reductase
VADPAAYRGSAENKRAMFVKIYTELDTRIKLFLNLPLHSIDSLSRWHR